MVICSHTHTVKLVTMGYITEQFEKFLNRDEPVISSTMPLIAQRYAVCVDAMPGV